MISPVPISRLTLFSAWKSPKYFVNPSMRINGAVLLVMICARLCRGGYFMSGQTTINQRPEKGRSGAGGRRFG
jgi:hypothetical protein